MENESIIIKLKGKSDLKGGNVMDDGSSTGSLTGRSSNKLSTSVKSFL